MTRTPEEIATAAAEETWKELLEVDDRTPPEEYPDMILIEFHELETCLFQAIRAERQAAEERVKKLADFVENYNAGNRSCGAGWSLRDCAIEIRAQLAAGKEE